VDRQVRIEQECHGARDSQCARRRSPEPASKADHPAPGKLDRVERCPHSPASLGESGALGPVARHLDYLVAAFAAFLLDCLVPSVGAAQHITIDGSLSAAQTLVGPNYTIGATLGKQVGSNLFHSFGIFGLSQGENATFSGPSSVTNVIGRVTGGTASSINGAINSTIAGANLYLINPSGVVFGPNARVNVSGSFHAATADYIRMSDGAKFQATNPSGSTLSAAPPAAFGFLTATPGRSPSTAVRSGSIPGRRSASLVDQCRSATARY